MYKDDIALIEQYLAHSLSEKDNENIELRLLNDSKFKELFHFIKDTQGAIKEAKKQEFVKQLETIESNYHQSNSSERKVIPISTPIKSTIAANRPETADSSSEKKVISISSFKKSLIAASALIIFGVFSLFLFDSNNLNNTSFSEVDKVRNILKESDSEVLQLSVFSDDINKLTGPAGGGTNGLSEKLMFKLPVVVLQDKRYPEHYFLKDTLYLFGSFGENILLTKDNTFLNLKIGLKRYQLEYKESVKIEALEKLKLPNNKRLNYEEN